MPAKTRRQQRFFGSELSRGRSGKKTRTGLGVGKLREMARKPKRGFKKRKRRR
jgi:hypothetical protein